jgi:hypothetical protein
MRFSKVAVAVAASGGAIALSLFATSPAVAATTGAPSYQAKLQALNNSGASGTVMLTLNGSQATITEHTDGLAATFSGNPYPHVQHIHINGKGTCPTPAADINNDGVVNTTEGGPSYGPIGTTLSTSGPTNPAAGTVLNIAPSGAGFDYSRTITLDAATLSALQANTGVVVVHGLDPATLSAKAQAEKSDLVPALPLAATSPALCGPLVAMQTSAVPTGGAATGGGGTSSSDETTLLIIGGALLAGAVTMLGVRQLAPKRISDNS